MLDWLAPSLDIETLDKRIQELKTVQFWLEQNSNAIASSIQLLQVQKMTLETLKGFNIVADNAAPDVAQKQALTAAWGQLQSQFDTVIQSVIPTSLAAAAPTRTETNVNSSTITKNARPNPGRANSPSSKQRTPKKASNK